LVRKK